ncbi:MAG: FAD-dependent oxidoreductase [Deltaproteobacteria bacterium]|nr:FAD-dependent oxidoreductase [Deltaproteobacteria bacterium]
MAALEHLFSPITIRNCRIRNRILQSGHITGFANKTGLPTERHVRYYERRAKGGIGLICTEAMPVSPHGCMVPGHMIEAWRDETIPLFRKISDAVHAHGTKIFAQVWHNGNQGNSLFSMVNTQSCSDVVSPAQSEVPDILDDDGIRKVIGEYVQACLRLKEGGYDGAELHFAHGYLPQQFLSPLTNLRKDKYGGNLENRMRFGLELIAEVREAAGDDFVLGLRASGDELMPNGLNFEAMKEIIPIWARTDAIDFLNISVATYKTAMFCVPPMMVPPRPFVYMAAKIKQRVDIPVFAAIRINDPVMANEIIKNHEADMVVMTRATICDPDLPNKAKEGRLDDIRQCMACNEGCWERTTRNVEITCTQNPEAGKEGVFQIIPATNPKRVMVVGGGCAGMEAAVIAKQRGHKVVLYEKAGALGGAVLIASRPPSREEFGRTVRFLIHELERLAVPVHLDTPVTVSLVGQEDPDVVIVATGGTTINDPSPHVVGPDLSIEIENGASVVTAEDVLQGNVETGNKVVIADCQSHMKGLITAEFLADQGKDVTVIMPLPLRFLTQNAYDMDSITHGIQIMNLTNKRVKRITDFEVKKAMPGKVNIRNMFTGTEEDMDTDTLVTSYCRKANAKLYEDLKGRVKEVHKIGDCLAPRRAINAIYEGYKVAMEI